MKKVTLYYDKQWVVEYLIDGKWVGMFTFSTYHDASMAAHAWLRMKGAK